MPNETQIGHNTGGFPTLVKRIEDYTPYNKRKGEVQAEATLRFTYYDGKSRENPEAWFEIRATEFVQDKRGTWREKTISIHLHGAELEKLRELLQMTKAEADFRRPLGV